MIYSGSEASSCIVLLKLLHVCLLVARCEPRKLLLIVSVLVLDFHDCRRRIGTSESPDAQGNSVFGSLAYRDTTLNNMVW